MPKKSSKKNLIDNDLLVDIPNEFLKTDKSKVELDIPNQKSEYFEMLTNFLDSDEKIETKTDLTKPISWSTLDVVINLLSDNSLVDSSIMLNTFKENSFKYLISNKRKGREEFIRAIQNSTRFIEDTNENEEKDKLKNFRGIF